MTLTIEPTNQHVNILGIGGTVWRGHTAGGIEVRVVICGMEVCDETRRRAYENEVATMPPPHPTSLRQVLAEM